MRGPGMARNASVAQRFRTACSARLNGYQDSAEPSVTPSMAYSQLANARNLLVMALNNVTCHSVDSNPQLCKDSAWLMEGGASTRWSDLVKVLAIATEHLCRWMP